jgi:hypothetical protein
MPLTVDFGRLQMLEVDSDSTLCCQVMLHFANPAGVSPSGFDPKALRNFWIRRGEGLRVTLDVSHGGNPQPRNLEHMARILCNSEASMLSPRYIF